MNKLLNKLLNALLILIAVFSLITMIAAFGDKMFKLGELRAINTVPTEVWNTIHDSTNTYYIVTGKDSTYSVVFGKNAKVKLPIDSFKVSNDNVGIWIKKPLSQIKN